MEETLEKAVITDEQIYYNLISQSLEGVMFHNYNIDIFDRLNLCGFKKLHEYQYKDESQNLKELKHCYIKKFNKIPIITNAIHFTMKSYENINEDNISVLVKSALDNYYEWENKVLDNLLTWRKSSKDKKIFQEKIQDVMKEIEKLETLLNILDEHEYNYQCIQEMSEYLSHC